MDNDELISTLNDLIETCKDGEEGFRTCSQDVEEARLKTLLATRSSNCAIAARELQGLVRSFGGVPADSSSLSGALHRRWVNIKSAIMGKDDYAILSECERGEDMAVRSYSKALKKDLPAEVKGIVNRQYMGVMQNHDTVKALRDELHAMH